MDNVVKDLKIAYSTEIQGYSFYTSAAQMIKDEHGKTVFRHLAKEELEHISVLGAISKSLEGEGKWMNWQTALAKGKPQKGAPIFLEKNKLTDLLKKNPTELNAVTIAVEAEEKAVDFYSKLLKRAEAPDEKVVLTKILDMERGHLKLLRWEQESIVHTGFWCDLMEFNIEKELE